MQTWIQIRSGRIFCLAKWLFVRRGDHLAPKFSKSVPNFEMWGACLNLRYLLYFQFKLHPRGWRQCNMVPLSSFTILTTILWLSWDAPVPPCEVLSWVNLNLGLLNPSLTHELLLHSRSWNYITSLSTVQAKWTDSYSSRETKKLQRIVARGLSFIYTSHYCYTITVILAWRTQVYLHEYTLLNNIPFRRTFLDVHSMQQIYFSSQSWEKWLFFYQLFLKKDNK